MQTKFAFFDPWGTPAELSERFFVHPPPPACDLRCVICAGGEPNTPGALVPPAL